MTNEAWYENFLEILYKKYPKKTQMTQALMNLLCLEREAVYRRLRKEVVFPANEIVKIATTLNISLDEIIGINSGKVSFQMQQVNYLDPSEKEAILLNNVIQSLYYVKDCPDTEFMDICNKLPKPLLAGYRSLNQYHLFKWMYQYSNENEIIPFADIVISKKKEQITEEYYKAIKHVPNSNFIWDNMLFEYLINDIKYFCSIYLITEEDKQLIKNDLHALLDYMLEVANKGCYPETGNKVNIYVSQINVDTNYSYTFTQEANICFVHVFEKFEIYTYNSEMVSNFKTWMQLKKRSAIQISEVDERSRIEFFTKQRKIVDSL